MRLNASVLRQAEAGKVRRTGSGVPVWRRSDRRGCTHAQSCVVCFSFKGDRSSHAFGLEPIEGVDDKTARQF